MRSEYNPYEVLYMYRTGDEHAAKILVDMYRGLAWSVTDAMIGSNAGMRFHREDMALEALAAILDAADAYRDDEGTSFVTFMSLIMRRRICNCVRYLTCPRMIPWDCIQELDAVINEDESLYDVIPQQNRLFDPEYVFNMNERISLVDHAILSCDDLGRQVLYSHMRGESYEEAAKRLHLTVKKYDGKLQQVRRKIRASLKS